MSEDAAVFSLFLLPFPNAAVALLKSLKNILYRNNSADTSDFSAFSSPAFFTAEDICM